MRPNDRALLLYEYVCTLRSHAYDTRANCKTLSADLSISCPSQPHSCRARVRKREREGESARVQQPNTSLSECVCECGLVWLCVCVTFTHLISYVKTKTSIRCRRWGTPLTNVCLYINTLDFAIKYTANTHTHTHDLKREFQVHSESPYVCVVACTLQCRPLIRMSNSSTATHSSGCGGNLRATDRQKYVFYYYYLCDRKVDL